MHVVRIPFRSLTIWALVVLQETADTAGSAPVVPTADLRLALAWIASVRPDEKCALDLFWQDATSPIPGGTTEAMDRYRRSLALKQRVSGMAERLLIGAELLGETQRRWKRGLFDGSAAAESHARLAERIAAYREEQKRRAKLY